MMRSSCALRDWAVACPMGRIFSLTSRPSSWIRVADARPPLIRTGAPGAPRLYARTVGWQTKRDRTLGPFAHRAFAVYWAGGLLSNIGTWLQNVAGSVFIYDRTGSAFAVGLLNFATFLPLLLFSVTGGVLSDRFPPPTIVLPSPSLSLLPPSTLPLAVASRGAAAPFLLPTPSPP